MVVSVAGDATMVVLAKFVSLTGRVGVAMIVEGRAEDVSTVVDVHASDV